ncbi:MAG: hypothetical protein QOH04_1604, partial [Sphingomonadales bacterium]|nr:hypothetical protein [Sphingomonadales bacterium]
MSGERQDGVGRARFTLWDLPVRIVHGSFV